MVRLRSCYNRFAVVVAPHSSTTDRKCKTYFSFFYSLLHEYWAESKTDSKSFLQSHNVNSRKFRSRCLIPWPFQGFPALPTAQSKCNNVTRQSYPTEKQILTYVAAASSRGVRPSSSDVRARQCRGLSPNYTRDRRQVALGHPMTTNRSLTVLWT
jgi:hypothetical protein